MANTFRMHADVETYNQDGFAPKVGMEVHFDLQITPGEFMRVSDEVRPTLLDFQRVTGHIRSDGRMYDKRAVRAAPLDLEDDGELGVELLSDDSDLNLDNGVIYKVTPEMPSERAPFTPFYIDHLPADDTEQHLADFAPGPGQSSIGDARGKPGTDGAGFASLVQGDDKHFAQPMKTSPDGPVPAGPPIELPEGPQGIPGPLGIAILHRGLWNASTNLPALQDGTGTAGDSWLVTTAGTRNLGSGAIAFSLGDCAIYNGTIWQRAPKGVVSPAGPVVFHGSDPDYPRPDGAGPLLWVGDVEPNNSLDIDEWDDQSGEPPTILTTVLNGMNKDAPFNQMLYANGTIPILWSRVSGSFPPGIDISTEGNLFGTPTATGTYTFELLAANHFDSVNVKHTYTVTVDSAIGPTITTADLGAFQAGSAYDLQMASSGSTPITYDIPPAGGAFPAGVTMNTAGHITGTPTTLGSGTVTIRANNGVGTNNKTFSWTVSGTPPTITTPSLGQMWRGFSAAQSLAYSGSSGGAWSKTGSFPTGVSMNSSGVLTGSPSVAGESWSVTVTVNNGYGTNSKTFSGTVNESTPSVAESSLGTFTVGVPYTKTLSLSSGGPTITWSSLGTLPAGITFDPATHTLSGTPTAAGSGTLTIRASNGVENDDQPYPWTVDPAAAQFDSFAKNSTSTSPCVVGTNGSAGAAGFILIDAVTNGATGTISATFDGSPMTQVGTQQNYGPYGGTYYEHTAVFKVDSLPGGAKNVSVACTGTVTEITAYFISATGVTTIGSLQTYSASGGSASFTINSGANHLALVMLCGAYSTAWSDLSGASATTRGKSTSGRSVCGSAPGASPNITITATTTASSTKPMFGVAVDLSP